MTCASLSVALSLGLWVQELCADGRGAESVDMSWPVHEFYETVLGEGE